MSDSESLTKRHEELERLASKGNYVLQYENSSQAHDEFGTWVHNVHQVLAGYFPGTGIASDWLALPISNLELGEYVSDSPDAWREFREAIRARIAWLARLQRAASGAQPVPSRAKPNVTGSGKIFVVHGRDEAAKEKVARFLTNLRLVPLILHEQANKAEL